MDEKSDEDSYDGPARKSVRAGASRPGRSKAAAATLARELVTDDGQDAPSPTTGKASLKDLIVSTSAWEACDAMQSAEVLCTCICLLRRYLLTTKASGLLT